MWAQSPHKCKFYRIQIFSRQFLYKTSGSNWVLPAQAGEKMCFSDLIRCGVSLLEIPLMVGSVQYSFEICKNVNFPSWNMKFLGSYFDWSFYGNDYSASTQLKLLSVHIGWRYNIEKCAYLLPTGINSLRKRPKLIFIPGKLKMKPVFLPDWLLTQTLQIKCVMQIHSAINTQQGPTISASLL